MIELLKNFFSSIKLNSLKNKYLNKECILIGNGLSVNPDDLQKLSHMNKVVFTFNRFYLAYEQYELNGFKSDYTVSIDPQMIKDFGQDIVDNSKGSKVLIGTDKKVNIKGNYIKFNIVNTKPFRFSIVPTDFISTGDSVVVAAIQLAYYMGMKKIYLYGIDHDFSYDELINGEQVRGGENHFIKNYRDDKPWYPPVVENIEQAFKECDRFLREKGGFLINYSRKTKLEVLEKRNFDDCL